MDFEAVIKKNNAQHAIDEKELQELLLASQKIFTKHFSSAVWFERSVFINWTCGIADCKYCYLSTKPKKDMHALRSKASILAEILVCKLMGWNVGYITGGLRVESTEYMVELLSLCEKVYGQKVAMNFGPYVKSEILAFKPHTSGIGAAIESFDEALHKYICPSKPLSSLKNMLKVCKEENILSFITIILGMGERKEDVFEVIRYVNEYGIAKVQLCFLKPQQRTIFADVPPPDPAYMAWWTAQLRIACPTLIIKIALVKERMADYDIILRAGANCFSRSLVFQEFGTSYAQQLVAACANAGRKLQGEFLDMPSLDIATEVAKLDLDAKLQEEITIKAQQYYERLLRKSSKT